MVSDRKVISDEFVFDIRLSSQKTGQQRDVQGCLTDRKRRRSGSSGYERENGRTSDDAGLLMSRSIRALQAQVSYLQLLLRKVPTSPLSTSTKHHCPVEGCGSKSSRLDYFQKHIRQSEDPAHQTVAAIINETHCVDCSKSWTRPTDLVRHEKYHHQDSYGSRLDKISGTSLQSSACTSRPLSPPSSVAEASDSSSGCSTSDTEDEAYTMGPDDRLINESSDSRALSIGSLLCPTRPNTSQPIQGLCTSTMADDIPRPQLLKEDQRDVAAEMTPAFLGQKVFNTNSGFGQNEVLPISGYRYISDSSLLATTRGNWPLAQSQNLPQYNIDIGLKPESQFDGFYPGDAAVLESQCDGFYPGDAVILERRVGGPCPDDAAALERGSDGFYPGDASLESQCDGLYPNDAVILERRFDRFYPGGAAVLESQCDGFYPGDASLESRWDRPCPGVVVSNQWDGLH